MSGNDKKRNLNDTGNPSSPSKKRKEMCSFKEQCYRKNPHHFMEYSHPHLEILLDLNEDEINLNIPDSYLEKSVVIEQLKILRDLKTPKTTWNDFKTSDQPACSSSGITPSNSKNSSNNNVITLADVQNAISNSSRSCTKANFAAKLKSNAPYNLFFTVIAKSPQTKNQNNSIEITDLLCPSLGKLKCSLQINFIIDVMWLLGHYQATGNGKKPLTILYGEEVPNMKEYMDKCYPNVTHEFIKMKDPFGTHHSKIGLYAYEDGSLRVVVSTANLYEEDWNNYCQGVWVSPLCPLLPEGSSENDCCGPTNFKNALIKYLQHYNLKCLDEWIARVKKVSFANVKVFFISTVPGKHPPKSTECHLQRVGDLLSRHCVLPETKPNSSEALQWSIIAQSSSLGNFGASAAAWLRTAFLRTLASHTKQPLPANSNAKLDIIFPTRDNVVNSYLGLDGGGCLPYSKKAHDKQQWLENYLHEWKAERTNRTRAMPHIKSYCRVSPEFDKLAYFLLTSANISKAAWGTLNKSDSSSYCRSCEVGVLFLPKFFDEEYFSINPKLVTCNQLFPFMYDLPLKPYTPNDIPWQQ